MTLHDGRRVKRSRNAVSVILDSWSRAMAAGPKVAALVLRRERGSSGGYKTRKMTKSDILGQAFFNDRIRSNRPWAEKVRSLKRRTILEVIRIPTLTASSRSVENVHLSGCSVSMHATHGQTGSTKLLTPGLSMPFTWTCASTLIATDRNYNGLRSK